MSVRRRSGPRSEGESPEGLSRAAVLSAALDLARRVGLDGFSMRDLAAELGTTQMAAYRYVKGREELMTLVVDEILSQIRLPGPEYGAWDERLRAVAESSLEVLSAWKGSSSFVPRVRPPRAAEMVAQLVAMLRKAGFAERDAALAARLLHVWTLGELTKRQNADPGSDACGTGEREPAAHELALAGLFRGIGDQDITAFSLDVLIDGLRVRLAATVATPEPGHVGVDGQER